MGIRETVGGMAEAALNDAVDKAFGDGDFAKMIGDKVAEEIMKVLGGDLKHKIKANYIDLIDGVDDIPDV